ncbi:unnamed protein product [marine sediment metagenome]|uniref:Uncharacterized protein n=1 Tax=marine sediment metagenome TaxID=412755 RepID=X1GR96_9ZZZZ
MRTSLRDASGARWKEILYTFEESKNPLFVTEVECNSTIRGTESFSKKPGTS